MTRSNNTTQPGNRAVGYVRRSTDRQEQSIPDQKKAIETYAAEHDLSLVKFYIDDAISGTSTLGRRAFQEMVQDAQKSTKRFDRIKTHSSLLTLSVTEIELCFPTAPRRGFTFQLSSSPPEKLRPPYSYRTYGNLRHAADSIILAT